jgi:Flp pilus assembly protein TadG
MPSKGQALVEFALAVPLFVLLAVGFIDFSRLLFTYVSLTHGARELARVAAITSAPSASVVAAFNDYTVFGGDANPLTDRLTITVANQSCASDQRRGLTCSAGTVASATCSLPLQAACAMPSRTSAGGGYIQVDVTYRFRFNPLFQNTLAGAVDAWFGRPFSELTTSSRTYVE